MARRVQPGVAAWYSNSTEAIGVLQKLEAAGISSEKISLMGRNFRSHAELQKYYDPAQDMGRGMLTGLSIGALAGLVVGLGLSFLPAFRSVLTLSPTLTIFMVLIVAAIFGALLGGFLMGIIALGLSGEASARYQLHILAGQCLLAVQGTREEVGQAQTILIETGKMETSNHEKSDS